MRSKRENSRIKREEGGEGGFKEENKHGSTHDGGGGEIL